MASGSRFYRLQSHRVEKSSHFIRGEYPPSAVFKIAEPEAADAAAMQCLDVIPDGCEHPTNLVVAPFSDRKPRKTRLENLERSGLERILFRLQHQRSAREHCRLVASQVTRKTRIVRFWQMSTRGRDAMIDLTVVGEEKKA